VLQASVQWRLNGPVSHGETPYFQTANLLLSGITTATDLPLEGRQLRLLQDHSNHDIAETKSSVFLISAVCDLLKKGSRQAAIKLLLPAEDGYVVRSDLLEQRLYGCPNAQLVEGFVAPREHLSKPNLSAAGLHIFSEILASAAGGIVVGDESGRPQEFLLSELEKEIHGRYSLPWLITEPIPERTIAILGHRSLFMMERWINGAKALGVKVLIFGERGSWLEDPQHAELVEEFLAIDMSVDQGLPSRIVDALQNSGHKIDGITTTIDVYFDAVAKVSMELGLHTSPIESLNMAQDKYATRTRFGNETPVSLLITGVEDLRQRVSSGTSNLTYPLIVKPSKGWCSEGVFKVTNENDLFVAVEKLSVFQPGIKIIVETYVDGPEVDANFLLWDGEILFFEVVDDFPCSADEPGSADTANFQELEMVYPSNLIESEKELLRTQIHRFLLEIGFRNGIFHVEARIQNSAMEYNVVDGVTDLRPKSHPPALENEEAKPKVFILEVNVRCPGWMVIWATCYAYGVDYAAAQMLAALNDSSRFRILSQPFRFGAQASVESVFVPTKRGGTIGGEVPICEEEAGRRPDLMKNEEKGVEVVRIQTMQQPGDVVPDPSSGTLSFVAAFNLATREGDRSQMLRVGQEIRKAVRVEMR